MIDLLLPHTKAAVVRKDGMIMTYHNENGIGILKSTARTFLEHPRHGCRLRVHGMDRTNSTQGNGGTVRYGRFLAFGDCGELTWTVDFGRFSVRILDSSYVDHHR